MKPLFNSSVSLILPTYNEGGHIQDLIFSISVVLADAAIHDYEIIIVDDNSPDLTWQKAGNVPNVDPAKIKVIRRMQDRGLTASLREGIAAAKSDVIVWMDCDFSHPPEKIPQMLFMIEQGYDIVVNSRYITGGGEIRVGKGGFLQLVLSRMLNWGTRFLLKPSFSDYTSGFIAVRSAVLKEIPLTGDYGEYFINFIYRAIRAKKYHICELPYVAMPRRSGESKTGTKLIHYLRRGTKYIRMVIKLRFSGN